MKSGRLIMALLVTGVLAASLFAQEHPEHPTDKKPANPEVTIDQMARAITDYVNSDTQLKGGYFLVFDSAAKKVLQLTLDKVHKDRLSQVGDNLFFACSDFTETGGRMYDLDFFMKNVGGDLTVTDIMIHKEDGKARYEWYEEDGVWKRK